MYAGDGNYWEVQEFGERGIRTLDEVSPYSLSRGAPSATRPPLRMTYITKTRDALQARLPADRSYFSLRLSLCICNGSIGLSVVFIM